MRDQTITIRLVTATSCANCVQANRAVAETVNGLWTEYPIELAELDLTEHPELLDTYDIWATPALIINDELAFVGKVDEQRLRAKLADIAGR